jgi:hypothetical protein
MNNINSHYKENSMAKVIFIMDDKLKAFYEGVARQLSVDEERSVSLSELLRRSLKSTYGSPKKEKKHA